MAIYLGAGRARFGRNDGRVHCIQELRQIHSFICCDPTIYIYTRCSEHSAQQGIRAWTHEPQRVTDSQVIVSRYEASWVLCTQEKSHVLFNNNQYPI